MGDGLHKTKDEGRIWNEKRIRIEDPIGNKYWWKCESCANYVIWGYNCGVCDRDTIILRAKLAEALRVQGLWMNEPREGGGIKAKKRTLNKSKRKSKKKSKDKRKSKEKSNRRRKTKKK